MIWLSEIKIECEEEQKNWLVVPRFIVNQTLGYIREIGEKKQEGLLFWAGIKSGQTSFVTSCIFPTARAQQLVVDAKPCMFVPVNPEVYIHKFSEPGIQLSSAESAKIISEASKRCIVILAQVHSHEGNAYHSGTDKKYPFDTTEGFLSIVVPEYGKYDDFLSSSAIFECGCDETFKLLTPQEIDTKIKVIDNIINLQ